MTSKFWQLKRSKVLPWVKDWKDPQDQVRFSSNVRDMCWNDWMFCHPSAFKLCYYGSTSIYIVLASITLYYLVKSGNGIIGTMTGIFLTYNLWDLWKKIDNWNRIRTANFYDLYMREY